MHTSSVDKAGMKTIQIIGQYYEKNSSQHFQGCAQFSSNGNITIKSSADIDGKVIVRAAINEVKLSNKLGNTPRQIIFPLGQLFSFYADEDIECWLAQRGKKFDVSSIEKNKLIITSALIMVPLMIYLIFTRAIPYVAIEFSQVVPESIVALSSQQTLSTLDKTLLSASNFPQSKQDRYLKAWRIELSTLVSDADKYHLQLRASTGLGANAFALPDGTIIITDDLVTLLAAYPDAIIAILLHEIGHVQHKHSMQYIAQTLATTVVVNYLLGDISGLIDLFVGASATFVGNQFSQELEWQADDYALAQLIKHQRSTESFAQAMELILNDKEEAQLDNLFSTHPMLRERAEHARIKNKQH